MGDKAAAASAVAAATATAGVAYDFGLFIFCASIFLRLLQVPTFLLPVSLLGPMQKPSTLCRRMVSFVPSLSNDNPIFGGKRTTTTTTGRRRDNTRIS